ncbi:MAG: CvpA family protein [Pseudomonadota bacterium]
MEFTAVDIGVGAIAAISGFLGYGRGFTREVFALFGWAIAGALGLYGAPFLEPLIREAPVIGDFLAGSCVLSMIAAITVLVALGLLILSVFTPLASSAVLDSALAPVDRALGFIYGVARGGVLVAVIYFVYVNVVGDQQVPMVENAQAKAYLDEALAQIQANMPTQVPAWFGERIDALMAPCGGNGITEPSTPGTEG